MKEFKGTPGPWVLLQAGDRITNKVPVDRGNASILTIVEEDGVKFAAVYEDQDAHLIAAAPELLEALQEVVAISDRKHEAWDKAHAAIAKALGGNHG